MTNYIILLPPSEGKKKGGDESKPYRIVENLRGSNSFIELNLTREFIYDKLREAISVLDTRKLEKVFELKGKKMQEAVEIISDLLNEETMIAIKRYEGVMFKAIKYSEMREKEKENFEDSVIFVDGMFGLLRPLDMIPEYKLKITSKFLDVDVTKFWKEKLVEIFEKLFENKLVIDLLPEAHRKVVSFPKNCEYYTIKFCTINNGKLVNVGHDSKILKGEIVNYITSMNKVTKADLELFKHSAGYSYSSEFSSNRTMVFMKK